MSEVIKNVSNETGKFKKIFEDEWKNGYNSCHLQFFDFLEQEINDLKMERTKSDDFDNAILSVLIGYLTHIQKKMIDLECPKR